jgi:putative ABC transport system ATP-binding protein
MKVLLCQNHQEKNKTMSKEIIKIQDLKREFTMGTETVHALRGISFSINEGEFVTIMGSSGSGKSTMLNILGCLDQPTSGLYEIDGVSVKDLNRNQLATIRNEKIGFIFQSYNLLARTSAIENVELPLLYNSKVTSEERRERAIKALQMVGLGERLDHTPSQLSGGQQQRVAIARSLVNNPVMILADEATGNLDTRTSYEIMSLFQELNKKGITITFVTHEPDIATFSGRTVVLKDGSIIKDYKNDNIQSAAAELAKLPKQDD